MYSGEFDVLSGLSRAYHRNWELTYVARDKTILYSNPLNKVDDVLGGESWDHVFIGCMLMVVPLTIK